MAVSLSMAAGESLNTNVRFSRPTISHDVTKSSWSKACSTVPAASAETGDVWCKLGAAQRSLPARSAKSRRVREREREREREHKHTQTYTRTHTHTHTEIIMSKEYDLFFFFLSFFSFFNFRNALEKMWAGKDGSFRKFFADRENNVTESKHRIVEIRKNVRDCCCLA